MSKSSILFLIALITAMGVMVGISIYFSLHHAHATPAAEFRYNMTVSKTDPGAYRTISEALAAAPTNHPEMFYIHISAGVYVEIIVVPSNLTNIVLVGDGVGVTNITMNRHAPEFKTFYGGTVTVFGAGFVAKFITFENSAGPGSQAVAVVIQAEECAFYKCTFLGFQDTLYAKYGKQLFRECDIYGTIDFIFGEAAAVFQSCNVFARAPNMTYFTAQGKRYPHSHSAFVFQNSSFTVAPGLEPHISEVLAYMGRPWFEYSTVVVMESYLDAIISPAGWERWPGNPTDKLTYVEYKNRGPGADTSHRVKWTGYKALEDAGAVKQFTVQELLTVILGFHGPASHTLLGLYMIRPDWCGHTVVVVIF